MPKVTPASDLTDRLGEVKLTDADGGSVRVGSLWEDAPVVLVHLRHFG